VSTTIEQLTSDSFNAVGQLRRIAIAPYAQAPQQVHAQIRSYFERMSHAAHREGISTEDVQSIGYALCALADEVVMSSPGPLRDYWMSNPLQLSYFNEHLAGENFFRRLDAMRRDPRKVAIVRVYYTCLLFGFQGRYRVRGAEVALADYIEGLRIELGHAIPRPEVLAPDGSRPQELLQRVARGLPVVWLSIGVVVLALFFYAGMQIVIDRAVTDLVGFLRQFTRG